MSFQQAQNHNLIRIFLCNQMLNCCIDKSQQREQHIQGEGDGGGMSRESETSFASCHSVSYKEFDQPQPQTSSKPNGIFD